MGIRRLAALACIGMFVLVGCRDRSTIQNKQDKLCVEMGEVDGIITQMTAYAATAQEGDLAKFRQLRDRLDSEWAEVEEAATKVTSFQINAVRDAYNKFRAVVNTVNDQATLQAKYAEIDAASGEFATARLDTYNTAGCA